MSIHWRIEKLFTIEMKSSFRFVKVFILLGIWVILFFLLSGCTFLPKEEPVLAPPLADPPVLTYTTAEVERGKIIRSVKGVGNLVPKNTHDLFYTKDGGRLKEIYVNKGDEVKKGQILAELDTGNLAFDIEQLKLDVKKAEIRLQQIRDQENPDKYAIEIAKLDLQGLRNRLNLLNKQLAEARIVSPIDGLVTFVADIDQGSHVPAYQSIIQVAETNELQLLYRAISATDIHDVTLGMEAIIDINGEKVIGTVVQIPRSVPADVASKDPDFYGKAIFIDIEELPEDVKVGDTLNFEIITAQNEDTLIIPRNALRSIIGRNYVQILVDDNTKREVDVQVGIISSTEVEILDGLEEGDKVIIR